MLEYKTVQKEASDSFTEKKSTFIGHCCPAETEAQAQAFIKVVRAKHGEANHNVYAYILRQGGIMRYSDDGEPQGTAGIPVLEVLKKSGICDAALVVTRYFGGILLGAGGLVRAYSHAASIAVSAAHPLQMQECILASLRCDYSRYNKAQEIAAAMNVTIDATAFDDAVTIQLHMLPQIFPQFTAKIADLTAGQGILIENGRKFFG